VCHSEWQLVAKAIGDQVAVFSNAGQRVGLSAAVLAGYGADKSVHQLLKTRGSALFYSFFSCYYPYSEGMANLIRQ
jgi:hypothetical protein